MTRNLWTVLVVLLLTTLPLQAMLRTPLPLPQALNDATLVVHATVVSAESAWAEDEWGRHIWTTYRLQVVETLKGDPGTDSVTLRVMGGTVGDRTELLFDVPRPFLDQEAVFLLEARGGSGPLAVAASLPVVADAVTLGDEPVPLSLFVEAVARLHHGDGSLLQSILPPTVLSTEPRPSTVGHGLARTLPAAEIAPMSTAKLEVTASIYDAWWTNPVDNDDDGYYQKADLVWDADVSDGSSTLTVYFDVFDRPSSGGEWVNIGTLGPYTITGLSSTDTVAATITGGGSPTLLDFAIAVYRAGESEYDHVLYPADDPGQDLDSIPFESPANDGGGGPTPTITTVTPDRAPAGTGDQVTITGTGFGSSQGQVKFTFQRGDSGIDTVSADIVSWADTRIVCTVPICRYAQGECGGYPGGSSSGPMWVVSSGGTQSTPASFEVPFGYGGQKWDPAQVNYQISTNVPTAFKTAVEDAFATWTAAAGINFAYSGSTSSESPTNNGTTEITYGPLPEGVPEGVIAFANCWPQGETTINECDMLLNSALNWSTSTSTPANAFDVESISLHEFGHWLVLLDLYGNEIGYVSDLGKAMYGFGGAGPEWNRRELHADDVLGVQWIYPGGTQCTYSISPTSASYGAAGGTGSVSVSTTAGCTWTASSNASWVAITSGSSGSGSGSVSYSVSANSGGTRTGTLTIAGNTFTITQSGSGGTSCTYSYWVPVVARQAGQGGSFWRADVGFVATGTSSATIEVRCYTSSATLTNTTSLAAGDTTIIRDVLNWLSPGYTGSGSLQVCSSQPLEVAARVYNQESSGATQGQGFDGVTSTTTLGAGDSALLPMLTQNGNAGTAGTYRTNIGVVNSGSSSASVTITLYDSNGNQVGSPLTKTYGASEVYQYSEPFKAAGRNDIGAGYARVTVNSGSGIYAYGSVLDNASNDPTTIGMRP